mgnify:CR=1 FL=1|jgi:mannosyltransferase OCH1-like enzyme|tara:strand:- start:6917 stop:7618 length:702 start_codon:yes stop_codon:yes gene_type:complete
MIPKNIMRIWLGKKKMPDLFEQWWEEFQVINKGYNFMTFDNDSIKDVEVPKTIQPLIDDVTNIGSLAGLADIYRILVVKQYGGIYIDCDFMPIRSFDLITDDPRVTCFSGKISKKYFLNCILGATKNHNAINEALYQFPKWYREHRHENCDIRTGPTFLNNVWQNRSDVTLYPKPYFHLLDQFKRMKVNGKQTKSLDRETRFKIFADKDHFSDKAIAVHFANTNWGGKPKGKL